ncbi:MAG: 16S rRNA (adenine(1518)-N(6)/adenine(1519)-N(6))-dimethyltransferase RsmA [Acidimicrobiales bacterium]
MSTDGEETARPPGRAELTAALADLGRAPSRALGQNFLADPNVAERIARLAAVGAGDRVIEIGAGLGSLTVALASTGAAVTALEIDHHLVPALRRRVEPLGVAVEHADATAVDWEDLLGVEPGPPWVLVANLPYNIATPLVVGLLRSAGRIGRMLVMVQKEVGERLVAAPRCRAYGAVSVRVAYFARARLLGEVPASVFVPRPNVASVLVEIVRRDRPAVDPAIASFEEIDRLVRAGFATRRKMLRRSLAGLASEADLEAAGISPTARAEELGVDEWGKVAARLRVGGRAGGGPPPLGGEVPAPPGGEVPAPPGGEVPA